MAIVIDSLWRCCKHWITLETCISRRQHNGHMGTVIRTPTPLSTIDACDQERAACVSVRACLCVGSKIVRSLKTLGYFCCLIFEQIAITPIFRVAFLRANTKWSLCGGRVRACKPNSLFGCVPVLPEMCNSFTDSQKILSIRAMRSRWACANCRAS